MPRISPTAPYTICGDSFYFYSLFYHPDVNLSSLPQLDDEAFKRKRNPKSKTMAPIRALLATLLLLGHALAVHLMKIISIDEYVERKLSQPEDDFPLFAPDRADAKHIEYWNHRLTHPFLQVVGPCRPPGDPSKLVCAAPPYPLFPLSEGDRNAVLMRPEPDVVRENIERATGGRLSTVDELVSWVNERVGDLGALSDDVVTLLSTNFAVAEAGVTVGVGCGRAALEIFSYSGWHEDMLVSQDEQRAMLAGWLVAFGDPSFTARRIAALGRHLEERGFREAPRPGMEEYKASVRTGAGRFRDRVERLDAEVLLSEAEWLARYDEYLAALRAEVYGVVLRAYGGWGHMNPKLEGLIPKIENIVSITEGEVSDEMICRSVPKEEPGFVRFLYEKLDGLRVEFPERRDGVLRRIAYRRWKTLSPESQAAYV